MLLAAVADAAAGGTPLECPGTGGYAAGMHHWREPAPQGEPAPSAGTAPTANALPDEATDDPPHETPHEIMDEAAALEALGGNLPLFVKLCQAFLDEVDARRAALVAAVREDRRQDALREAHALRNSAGMLRLSALHGLCDAMESAAARPAGSPDGHLGDLLDQLLPMLDAGVARVRAVTTGESDAATPGTAPAKEMHR